MINEGIISLEQIPNINWDGKNDLILLNHWIVKDKAIYSSFDELIEEEIKKVGMPPKIFCIMFDWIAKIGTRYTTKKIRKSNYITY